MDKKNTTIGVLLFVAAFAIWYISLKSRPAPAAPVDSPASPTATAPASGTLQPEAASTAGATAPAPANSAAFVAATPSNGNAEITTLANDFIEVRFTEAGGAISDVALKKYPLALGSKEPYVFNARHADPMLALVDFAGLDRATRFERISKTDTEIVYRARLADRLEVTRRYTLSPNSGDKTDPYQIRTETTFRNLTDQTVAPLRVSVAIGTASPASPLDPGTYTSTGFSTGPSQSFLSRTSFDTSQGFFGFGAHDARPPLATQGPIAWGVVMNQFFLSLLTPDQPAAGLVSGRLKLREALPQEMENNTYGIAGTVQFDVPAIAPHGETKLGGQFYVGPKEYSRLSNADVFKADQDKVMQFGFFGWASKLLLTLMTKIHNVMPQTTWSWGFAIILTTLTLKIVFFWPTFAGARSMRRMAKLQPQMALIREKYKDNPQKQHSAQMELWKEHKVNPMGGCLPMLIPMPFFFGFFSMLQHTAELRLAPFLWAGDLSAPDTVGHLPYFGIAINVLPLIFTAITFVQMKMTPTPNADPTQAKMMQFMPLVFLFIYYSFSCALSLYSMTNALFTIGQQYLVNRLKDDGDPANHPTTIGGKPVKNVTPKKGDKK